MEHLSMDIRVPIELENPSITRDEAKCVKCAMCKNICQDYISVHNTYSLEKTNNTAICIYCGQCANVCPTASITEKYEYKTLKELVLDKQNIVIFNTSPSVRISLGEEFSMPDGSFVQGKLVALLRKLGASYVLDTNFSADLTIMEEASELIERIKNSDAVLPQFTSCCPAWVKFVEIYYKELIPHLSTAKSPIGMQGPTVKTYFASKNNIEPKRIINVAVTPCTAKKFEIRRDEMNISGRILGDDTIRDMDYVITTRELALWAKEENIDFASLEDSEYDDFMGKSSGAGVIFANSGGVMEAATRTAYKYLTGKDAPETLYNLQDVRGLSGIKEATLDIDGTQINIAVVYGTKNAREIISKIKSGEKNYHFIEVMTCPGGCIGGGGQPKSFKGDEIRQARISGIYDRDSKMTLRDSHKNPQIIELYENFYGKPLSEKAKEMLHTTYYDRSNQLG